MITRKTVRSLQALLLGPVLCVSVTAQTLLPVSRTAESQITKPPRPVQVETSAPAPQVVTILHRLNGLKVIRLLLRGNEQFGALANIDEAFQLAGDVHTNVIAGLALSDGQTIAAWLPEAEAELPPPLPFAPAPPTAPAPPGSTRTKSGPAAPMAMPALPPNTFQRSFTAV